MAEERLRSCAACRRTFVIRDGRQRFCSLDCRIKKTGSRRQRPSPAARGLGSEHRKRRAQMKPPRGEPCPFSFCGKPMWPWQKLDADHVIPRSRGGGRGPLRWAHSSCNRRAGALLLAEMKRSKSETGSELGEPSRRW